MRTNAINNASFNAKLRINCPKDMITVQQIELLTKQAENVGSKADTITVNIKKRESSYTRLFYQAKTFFHLEKEDFTTVNDVLYEENGFKYSSNAPFHYIKKVIEKLRDFD